jgi:hypothetical protein
LLASVIVVQQSLLRHIAFDAAHFEKTLGGVVTESALACERFGHYGSGVVILAAVIGAAVHLIHIILPLFYCIYSTRSAMHVWIVFGNIRKALPPGSWRGHRDPPQTQKSHLKGGSFRLLRM